MKRCNCSLGPTHPDCCLNNTEEKQNARLGKALTRGLVLRQTATEHPIDTIERVRIEP